MHRIERDIWAHADHAGGEVRETALELLGEARRVAKASGGQVCAMLVGRTVHHLVSKVIPAGADRVVVCEDDRLGDYHPEITPRVVSGLIRSRSPLLVLFSANPLGDDLACRVAMEIDRRPLRGCVDFEVAADGVLQVVRPIFKGRFHAVEICERAPMIATVPPDVVGKQPADPLHRGEEECVPVPPEATTSKIRAVKFIEGDPRTLDLTEAEVIVAGGHGLGGPEGFELLQELADELRGTVGATRPAVDDKWVPFEKQVGQTGRTVRPKLYVACGISGAIQHIMGMRDSETIIAINKDPSAPIFQIASLGVEGDLYEVIPALIQCIRERKSQSAPRGGRTLS
jgi:electron transfer flavoprotein alpha subunit